ncbi:MAG TPA: TIR domain-containing protein [Dehalococcoidales bacterium]|nr:TIR domain-containing protein [Dehalococcoidales bacterium]
MAKTKVFASYDYEHDSGMLGNLIAQSKRPDFQFSINNLSLKGKMSDWQQQARKAIEECDVFIVLLRENTHQASGVQREVKMAREMNRRRFQLREKGHNPKPFEDCGEVVAWTKKNLQKYLSK